VVFKPGRNIHFSTYPPPTLIHLSHRFTSASKPTTWKPFDCCLSNFRTSISTCPSSAKRLPQVVNRFTRQTLPYINRKYFFMNILRFESFCPQKKKTHNRTLLFGNTLLKNGLHFDYWNQLLNVRMSVCYVDCHEDGLCCYLVMHIENLLLPLELFYFHLWPIYWLSLVYSIEQQDGWMMNWKGF
jgi:hypothetical protein